MDLNRYYNNMLRILVREQNSEGLNANEIQLLDALAKCADMWQWPKEFTPRNNLLIMLTQWGSSAKVKRVRASLVDKGFIFFKPRKRKPGIYSFTNKLTGSNVKKANKTPMAYSTSTDSNMIHLFKSGQPIKKETVRAKHISNAEQVKADHLKYWPLFVEAIKPAINDADISQKDQIREYFRELDMDFIREMIYRFDKVNWSKIMAPAPYLIKSLTNDLRNQRIRDSLRTKEENKNK